MCDYAGTATLAIKRHVEVTTSIYRFLYDKCWKSQEEMSDSDKEFLTCLYYRKFYYLHELINYLSSDVSLSYEQLQEVTGLKKPIMHERTIAASLDFSEKTYEDLYARSKKYFKILTNEEEPWYQLHPDVDHDKLLDGYLGSPYQKYIGRALTPETVFFDEDGEMEIYTITMHKVKVEK